jgi:hypothetical protein
MAMPAAAWEYSGFRGGMSLAETSEVARAHGRLHPAENIAGLYSLKYQPADRHLPFFGIGQAANLC